MQASTSLGLNSWSIRPRTSLGWIKSWDGRTCSCCVSTWQMRICRVIVAFLTSAQASQDSATPPSPTPSPTNLLQVGWNLELEWFKRGGQG